MRYIVFVFVLSITQVLSLAGDGFQVLQPPNIAGSYQAGRLTKNPVDFNITGILIQADPYDACRKLRNADFIIGRAQNESIIVIFEDSSCSYDTQLSNIIQLTGIVGAVMVRLDAAVGSGIYSADSSTVLAGVEITKTDGANVISQMKRGPVLVTITNPAKNYYAEVALGSAGVAFRVVFGMLTIGTIVLSAYKITGYIQSQGVKPSFPQLCLVLEIFLAIVRMLMLVDPFVTGDIMDIRAEFIIVGVQYFLLNTTILLVAFYWQEALQSAKINSLRLEKMKIPAMIVLGIWWTICIIMIILVGLGYLIEAQYIFSAAYASSIAFAGFFIWTAVKIFKILYKNREVSIGRKHYRMTFMILLTSFGIVANIFSAALYLTPLNTIKIDVTIGLTGLGYISFYIISFSQIMVFQAPQRTNWFCCTESSLVVPSPTSHEEHPTTTNNTMSVSVE